MSLKVAIPIHRTFSLSFAPATFSSIPWSTPIPPYHVDCTPTRSSKQVNECLSVRRFLLPLHQQGLEGILGIKPQVRAEVNDREIE